VFGGLAPPTTCCLALLFLLSSSRRQNRIPVPNRESYVTCLKVSHGTNELIDWEVGFVCLLVCWFALIGFALFHPGGGVGAKCRIPKLSSELCFHFHSPSINGGTQLAFIPFYKFSAGVQERMHLPSWETTVWTGLDMAHFSRRCKVISISLEGT
jgi:hypothetical protein